MDKAKLIGAAIMALALAACSPTVGNLCTAGPIITDQGAAERLTRSEKEQIVTLNQSGRAICGWRSLT